MREELNEETVDFFNNVAEKVFLVQFGVSIVGVLMNIPHLFILCQSSMRTSSTNALMIGIALCDLAVLSQVVHERVQSYWLSPFDTPCFNFNNYYYQLVLLIGDFLRETCEKASFWIGVFLALTRVLIMKLNTDTISKPLTGYLFVLLVLAITSVLNSYYYTKMTIAELPFPWEPEENCKGFSANYTESLYYRIFNENYDLDKVVGNHVMISGVSRILISVIYPILTIFLIFEIRKSARFVSAATLSKKSTLERHRTGRMILVMTMFYVIASAPGGVSDFIHIYSDTTLVIAVGYGSILISALFCFNAASHSVINFTMSSKYRTTVKMILGFRKKRILVTSVTATSIKSIPPY